MSLSRAGARRLLILAALLAAFGLRAATLDLQSFWSDEGISVLRSAQPAGQMLERMPVEHVPGYFLLLHYWMQAAGSSDFAVRFLSLWPGVLAVALIYRLGMELGEKGAAEDAPGGFGSAPAALTAAYLLATGAFQVWYAQEARMYTWLLAAGLASSLLCFRLLADDHSRRPAQQAALVGGYAAATAATVYMHYYGFLAPAAHTVFALTWALWGRRRRALGYWALGGALAFLLFLPWLGRAAAVFGFPGWRTPGDPAEIPWRYLAAFTVGDPMPQPWRAWLPWLYLALALLGAWWWGRPRPGRRITPGALFLLINLLAPFAAILALAARQPDYHERYAILLSWPLLLLAGGGVAALLPAQRLGAQGRRTAAALRAALAAGVLGLLFAPNVLALSRMWSDPAVQKPDFRGAAQAISRGAAAEDAVLIDGPDPSLAFLRYYSGPAPVHDLRFLLDADGAEVDAALSELTAGAPRAWELLYFHAPGPVQVWLATRGWSAPASDFNGIRVTTYELPAAAAMTSRSLGLDVGPALRLERSEVTAGPLAPGAAVRVSTHWFVKSQAPEYKFSLRLRDEAGQVLLAHDYVPQNGFAPTNIWLVERPATDQRSFFLPAQLPAGRYTVTLRLYDPVSGAPVETAAGQDIPLGELVLEAAP